MTKRSHFGAALVLVASATLLALCTGDIASAEDANPPAAGSQDAGPPTTTNGGAGIRAGNIAGTGKTMPNPGGSRGAGTTSLDRGIQERDNQISGSICKGC